MMHLNFINITVFVVEILVHARIHLFIIIFSNSGIILARHLIGVKS